MEIRESQRMYLLERERLEPPCLTEDQERIGELYAERAELESRLADILDELRERGEAVWKRGRRRLTASWVI